jgi:hypothetical protein
LSVAQERSIHDSLAFGTSIEAYEFQPGFLLTLTRGPDGRPMELVVHKATLAGRGHPDNTFTWSRVDPFLDKLAPPAERGERLTDRGGVSCFATCFETREYAGAVVTIVYNEFDPTREIDRLEVRFRSGEEPAAVPSRPN